MKWKVEKLKNGETFITKCSGESMVPLINSRQEHKLSPVKSLEEVEIDDIVFCKVKGKFFTHLVKDKHPIKGVLIGSNRGRINGWSKIVYGKVVEIIQQT